MQVLVQINVIFLVDKLTDRHAVPQVHIHIHSIISEQKVTFLAALSAPSCSGKITFGTRFALTQF